VDSLRSSLNRGCPPQENLATSAVILTTRFAISSLDQRSVATFPMATSWGLAPHFAANSLISQCRLGVCASAAMPTTPRRSTRSFPTLRAELPATSGLPRCHRLCAEDRGEAQSTQPATPHLRCGGLREQCHFPGATCLVAPFLQMHCRVQDTTW